MPTPPQGFAVIDGALCRLGPFEARSTLHAPLATAVAEFRRGPLCTYVRELPHGLLPGLPNLYCLDGAGRLQWMAEWPEATDPCAEIVDEAAGVLMLRASSGAMVRLTAATGRLLDWEVPAVAAV